jgi:hypothetical protein
MNSDFVLQILSSSVGLTNGQIVRALTFLGVNRRYKDLHCFATSVNSILENLMKMEYVLRYKSLGSGEFCYRITDLGLEYLQTSVDVDLTKTILQRVS